MKKLIIFLITLISLLGIKNVNASTTTFYESEYIPNVWLNKKNPDNGLIYYNQARIIRETTTNNVAYCIEPFVFFQENSSYIETTSPTNYTQEQITDMTLVSHFGFGYKDHTDIKWYAITQFMLWKIVQPNATIYFSSYKNGPATTMFEEEINEINALINEYKKNISFNKNTYYLVENEQLTIQDANSVLSTFTLKSDKAIINNNELVISPLTEGQYNIVLEKQIQFYNRPILFYQSSTNQDLIDVGDPPTLTNTVTLNVIKTSVTILKRDKDTISPTPQGEASLAGTKLSIYTSSHKYIKDITIDENSTAIVENLPFGSYYLKEKEPGVGYKINENKHYFRLTAENPTIIKRIYNEVIKAKVQIKKEYGYKNNFNPEVNISFNIHDHNNNLIKTIITNEEGITEITLPYGKYKITQLTTTEGYNKIEPITFEITSEETLYYNLKNYQIEIPNTYTESFINKLINFIKDLLCGKK